MAFLINPQLLPIDKKNINNIVNNIFNKNFNFKHDFTGNFEQNRQLITKNIIEKINKKIISKEVINNDFYTEQPGIFLNIKYPDMTIDIVILKNMVLKVNEYNEYNYKYKLNHNSIIITNLITSILQYDFNIKYEFKDFDKNIDLIKEELINRININEIHNIKVSEFVPIKKLKKFAIYLKIIDISKINTSFLIVITENKIL